MFLKGCDTSFPDTDDESTIRNDILGRVIPQKNNISKYRDKTTKCLNTHLAVAEAT